MIVWCVPVSPVYIFQCLANPYNFLPNSILNNVAALQLCREVERQSMLNLHVLGSKLGECVLTAVYRLSDKKEGDPKMGTVKYR